MDIMWFNRIYSSCMVGDAWRHGRNDSDARAYASLPPRCAQAPLPLRISRTEKRAMPCEPLRYQHHFPSSYRLSAGDFRCCPIAFRVKLLPLPLLRALCAYFPLAPAFITSSAYHGLSFYRCLFADIRTRHFHQPALASPTTSHAGYSRSPAATAKRTSSSCHRM